MGVIICVVGAILTIALFILFKLSNNKHYDVFSFKEAIDLADMPIITFYNNNRKFNFLLDTGSAMSAINKSVLCNIKHSLLSNSISYVGINGIDGYGNTCNIKVKYKDTEFEDEFAIIDLDDAFNSIKNSTGVQIHGILGTKFFEKYKYVLDFSNLTVYRKK